MLVPHLYLNGECEEALKFYEKVFNTKTDRILYNSEVSGEKNDKGVCHAEMHIHGQRIMLNDRASEHSSGKVNLQLVVIFDSEDDFMKSYKTIIDGGTETRPPEKTFYSSLVCEFTDKFGIHWSFMTEK